MKFTKPNKKNVNKIIKFLGKGAIVWLIRMRQVCIYPKLLNESFKSLENEGFVSENQDPDFEDIFENTGVIELNEKEKQEYNNILTTTLTTSSKIKGFI